jgi:hypothetical protein
MNNISNIRRRLLVQFLRFYTSQSKNKNNTVSEKQVDSDLSIVISTFEKRFFDFTLPLISAIRSASSLPITIVINGNYESLRDPNTYKDFVVATQRYDNIGLVTFNSFRGWASLLNAGILHSDTNQTLVLNDDIYVNPENLEFEFARISNELKKSHLLLLNNSWSHFAIDRECLIGVGFFDENFLGIGQEDGDYASRFQEKYEKEVPTLELRNLINFVDHSRDESISVTNGKYSLFNDMYLKFKMNKGDWSLENGSLQSIYEKRTLLYKCLSWNDPVQISTEIAKTLKNPPNSNEIEAS